ncbi:hypothetical protein [Arthrobacter sp. LFS091]|uniref:hypothetical protein n=1 Tax=Arthrobacter sp. LFS091 TaxID=3229892 RepID=UPI003A803760
MPNIQESFSGPNRQERRYTIKATGETGSALSSTHGGTNVGRYATIGKDLNVTVIDICLDETGEIRTYRQEFLEEVTE